MGKVKLILGLAGLALAIIVGWQIASCALANLEFHEDLRDLAAQGGARIGLGNFSTDEDLRDAVIREAKKYEIQLEPEQVTVRRAGTAKVPIIYLAADYKAHVMLPVCSFTLHFNPSSAK
jgi:hypothetical protein